MKLKNARLGIDECGIRPTASASLEKVVVCEATRCGDKVQYFRLDIPRKLSPVTPTRILCACHWVQKSSFSETGRDYRADSDRIRCNTKSCKQVRKERVDGHRNIF